MLPADPNSVPAAASGEDFAARYRGGRLLSAAGQPDGRRAESDRSGSARVVTTSNSPEACPLGKTIPSSGGTGDLDACTAETVTRRRRLAARRQCAQIYAMKMLGPRASGSGRFRAWRRSLRSIVARAFAYLYLRWRCAVNRLRPPSPIESSGATHQKFRGPPSPDDPVSCEAHRLLIAVFDRGRHGVGLRTWRGHSLPASIDRGQSALTFIVGGQQAGFGQSSAGQATSKSSANRRATPDARNR